jgi:hypothetical protein
LEEKDDRRSDPPPLVGVLWLLFFIELRVIPLAVIYGVLLPAGAGFVVRWRGVWRRSRFEEAF